MPPLCLPTQPAPAQAVSDCVYVSSSESGASASPSGALSLPHAGPPPGSFWSSPASPLLCPPPGDAPEKKQPKPVHPSVHAFADDRTIGESGAPPPAQSLTSAAVQPMPAADSSPAAVIATATASLAATIQANQLPDSDASSAGVLASPAAGQWSAEALQIHGDSVMAAQLDQKQRWAANADRKQKQQQQQSGGHQQQQHRHHGGRQRQRQQPQGAPPIAQGPPSYHTQPQGAAPIAQGPPGPPGGNEWEWE